MEPIEETPGDFTEPAALRTLVQERAGRTTRGSRGSLWWSPPSQELKSRVEANSGQGGREEAVGELQENSKTSGSFSEPAAPQTSVQGRAGRATRGSQGSWWLSPPSQELESRVGASSGQGGLEEALGTSQEDSQTSGSFSEPVARRTLVQKRPGRAAK